MRVQVRTKLSANRFEEADELALAVRFELQKGAMLDKVRHAQLIVGLIERAGAEDEAYDRAARRFGARSDEVAEAIWQLAAQRRRALRQRLVHLGVVGDLERGQRFEAQREQRQVPAAEHGLAPLICCRRGLFRFDDHALVAGLDFKWRPHAARAIGRVRRRRVKVGLDILAGYLLPRARDA